MYRVKLDDLSQSGTKLRLDTRYHNVEPKLEICKVYTNNDSTDHYHTHYDKN
jgi:hypothetical protein